jgi:hypothetical protein
MAATIAVIHTITDRKKSDWQKDFLRSNSPVLPGSRVGYFFVVSIKRTTKVTNAIMNIAVFKSIGSPPLRRLNRPPCYVIVLTLLYHIIYGLSIELYGIVLDLKRTVLSLSPLNVRLFPTYFLFFLHW